MNTEIKTCFADSRRLTGPNVWLTRDGGSTGAVLETVGELANDAAAHRRWAVLVSQMSAALGWPAADPLIKVCASTTILAMRAPTDLLLLATDVNEWAWEAALGAVGGVGTDGPYADFQAMHGALGSFGAALACFRERAANECSPLLMALLDEAQRRQIPVLQDDALFTLGTGSGARTWPLAELPAFETVPWQKIGSVPALLVSGTNGKTTSVRLLAAMAKQAGWRVGYCCTEGVYVDGVVLDQGDYAGPAGARSVLRQTGISLAVLEMARGGILRRGLALDSAQVALITNVSPEHFGEYGVENIGDLADVKLVLAQALGPDGTLVLNADDPVLLARGLIQTSPQTAAETSAQTAPQTAAVRSKLAWFALDYAHPALEANRVVGAAGAGGACCGVQAGRLLLYIDQQTHDLGAIADMPLTMHGSATYNIANCAGAALSAAAFGMAPATIAQVLAQFGQSRLDNPGRLERWHLPDLTVLLDYAHNPEGLSGLLAVARACASGCIGCIGRIGLLLGQAGNRSNEAIGELAVAAAAFAPDRIVLKDIPGYMRGREVGEVPALLLAQLLKSGYPAQHIDTVLPEVEAACTLLRWAKAGDVLVLPVHDKQAKQQMQTILDTLEAAAWCAGQPLPTALLVLPASPVLSTSPLPSSPLPSLPSAAGGQASLP